MNKQNSRLTVLMPIMLALAIILGMFIGNRLGNRGDSKLMVYPQQDKLNAVLDYIEQEYVDSVSKDELVELTIPEVLMNLDPHSIYIPAVEFDMMNEPLEGNFDGIGVQFNIIHDTIVVVNTVPGGPSEIKGVMPGDRIVKIDDIVVTGTGISTTEVMKKLKGKKGTKVRIDVKRKGVPGLLNYEITRNEIPLESVDVAYMIDRQTGYIKISKFAKTTYQEFKDAVAQLKTKGMKKVIIDLRNNSGGYMDAATNLADEFLEDGKLIVYTQGRSRPKVTTYATEKGFCHNDKVVVILDEWSASASEIFAGAIQDNDRGMIVGRRSFGKALVQEPTMFSDGSSMRLTIARYYTPTGRCIQKSYSNGLEDYFMELGERYDNGEFEVKDSIHFSDSLKYQTAGGRTVYGGGGIMPDVFVPVDTTGVSDFYTNASNKGLIYQFAFDYTDNHRAELSAYKSVADLEKFLSTRNLMKLFIAYAEKNGLPADQDGLEISGEVIFVQIKAYIARNLLDNKGFYPIIKQLDTTLLKAVDVISAM